MAEPSEAIEVVGDFEAEKIENIAEGVSGEAGEQMTASQKFDPPEVTEAVLPGEASGELRPLGQPSLPTEQPRPVDVVYEDDPGFGEAPVEPPGPPIGAVKIKSDKERIEDYAYKRLDEADKAIYDNAHYAAFDDEVAEKVAESVASGAIGIDTVMQAVGGGENEMARLNILSKLQEKLKHRREATWQDVPARAFGALQNMLSGMMVDVFKDPALILPISRGFFPAVSRRATPQEREFVKGMPPLRERMIPTRPSFLEEVTPGWMTLMGNAYLRLFTNKLNDHDRFDRDLRSMGLHGIADYMGHHRIGAFLAESSADVFRDLAPNRPHMWARGVMAAGVQLTKEEYKDVHDWSQLQSLYLEWEARNVTLMEASKRPTTAGRPTDPTPVKLIANDHIPTMAWYGIGKLWDAARHEWGATQTLKEVLETKELSRVPESQRQKYLDDLMSVASIHAGESIGKTQDRGMNYIPLPPTITGRPELLNLQYRKGLRERMEAIVEKTRGHVSTSRNWEKRRSEAIRAYADIANPLGWYMFGGTVSAAANAEKQVVKLLRKHVKEVSIGARGGEKIVSKVRRLAGESSRALKAKKTKFVDDIKDEASIAFLRNSAKGKAALHKKNARLVNEALRKSGSKNRVKESWFGSTDYKVKFRGRTFATGDDALRGVVDDWRKGMAVEWEYRPSPKTILEARKSSVPVSEVAYYHERALAEYAKKAVDKFGPSEGYSVVRDEFARVMTNITGDADAAVFARKAFDDGIGTGFGHAGPRPFPGYDLELIPQSLITKIRPLRGMYKGFEKLGQLSATRVFTKGEQKSMQRSMRIFGSQRKPMSVGEMNRAAQDALDYASYPEIWMEKIYRSLGGIIFDDATLSRDPVARSVRSMHDALRHQQKRGQAQGTGAILQQVMEVEARHGRTLSTDDLRDALLQIERPLVAAQKAAPEFRNAVVPRVILDLLADPKTVKFNRRTGKFEYHEAKAGHELAHIDDLIAHRMAWQISTDNLPEKLRRGDRAWKNVWAEILSIDPAGDGRTIGLRVLRRAQRRHAMEQRWSTWAKRQEEKIRRSGMNRQQREEALHKAKLTFWKKYNAIEARFHKMSVGQDAMGWLLDEVMPDAVKAAEGGESLFWKSTGGITPMYHWKGTYAAEIVWDKTGKKVGLPGALRVLADALDATGKAQIPQALSSRLRKLARKSRVNATDMANIQDHLQAARNVLAKRDEELRRFRMDDYVAPGEKARPKKPRAAKGVAPLDDPWSYQYTKWHKSAEQMGISESHDVGLPWPVEEALLAARQTDIPDSVLWTYDAPITSAILNGPFSDRPYLRKWWDLKRKDIKKRAASTDAEVLAPYGSPPDTMLELLTGPTFLKAIRTLNSRRKSVDKAFGNMFDAAKRHAENVAGFGDVDFTQAHNVAARNSFDEVKSAFDIVSDDQFKDVGAFYNRMFNRHPDPTIQALAEGTWGQGVRKMEPDVAQEIMAGRDPFHYKTPQDDPMVAQAVNDAMKGNADILADVQKHTPDEVWIRGGGVMELSSPAMHPNAMMDLIERSWDPRVRILDETIHELQTWLQEEFAYGIRTLVEDYGYNISEIPAWIPHIIRDTDQLFSIQSFEGGAQSASASKHRYWQTVEKLRDLGTKPLDDSQRVYALWRATVENMKGWAEFEGKLIEKFGVKASKRLGRKVKMGEGPFEKRMLDGLEDAGDGKKKWSQQSMRDKLVPDFLKSAAEPAQARRPGFIREGQPIFEGEGRLIEVEEGSTAILGGIRGEEVPYLYKGEYYLVPKPVQRKIEAIKEGFQQRKGFTTLGPVWKWATQFWKGMATVVNPRFHERNMVGSMYNAWLHDVSDPQVYFDAMSVLAAPEMITRVSGEPLTVGALHGAHLSAKEVRAGASVVGFEGRKYTIGDVAKELEQNGVVLRDSMPLRVDMGLDKHLELQRIFGAQTREEKIALQLQQLNPMSRQFGLVRLGREVGSSIEAWVRAAAYIDGRVNKGMGIRESISRVIAAHFDYDDLTPALRWARDNVTPFSTWVRKNLGLQLDRIVQRPDKLYRDYQLLSYVNLMGKDDEVDMVWLADYFRQRYHISIQTGAASATVYSLGLPRDDLTMLDMFIPRMLGGPAALMPKLAHHFLSMSYPMFQIPFQEVMEDLSGHGYEFFSGRKILDKWVVAPKIITALNRSAFSWHDNPKHVKDPDSTTVGWNGFRKIMGLHRREIDVGTDESPKMEKVWHMSAGALRRIQAFFPGSRYLMQFPNNVDASSFFLNSLMDLSPDERRKRLAFESFVLPVRGFEYNEPMSMSFMMKQTKEAMDTLNRRQPYGVDAVDTGVTEAGTVVADQLLENAMKELDKQGIPRTGMGEETLKRIEGQ